MMTSDKVYRTHIERLETENEKLRQQIDRLRRGSGTVLDLGKWYGLKERFGLTPVQAQIAALLSARPGEIVTTRDIVASVNPPPHDPSTLRVHIGGIRRVLKAHGIEVHNARGAGYYVTGWPE